MSLPQRLAIPDELGRKRTLLSGSESHQCLSGTAQNGGAVLLLGLGPEPQALKALCGRAQQVAYVECPDFAAAMPETWQQSIPAEWTRLSPQEALLLVTRANPPCVLWLYRQAPQLFSAFWGPLLAGLQARALPPASPMPPAAATPHLVLAGGEGELIHHELLAACSHVGIQALRLDNAKLVAHLREARPALVVSINLSGLDAQGETFHRLQALGIPLAIWFVDNPWHILSKLKAPWWRSALLCVSDASFIPSLQKHGTTHILHLPLGAWQPANTAPVAGEPLQPIVFVGRSAFPHKEQFFAGSRADQTRLDAASTMLNQGLRPDYHWWTRSLAPQGEEPTLWPGMASRAAGLGAEASSLMQRCLWLREALPFGLTIFGDPGWHTHLAHGAIAADIRGPLDYYAGLFDIYRKARYSLNVTSLLLPQGLSQRHFDVWMAGGFLLTDSHPGLDIFDSELTEAIRIPKAQALGAGFERFEKDTALYNHLKTAWRAHLLARHLYEHRLAALFAALDLSL